MRRNLFALVLSAPVLLAACSTGGSSASAPMSTMSSGHSMGSMAGMDGSDQYAFGHPAEASGADRVVRITTSDQLRFDPSKVNVPTGATVTFEVTNASQAAHEFVLGDASYQDDHEMSMGQMSGSLPPDEPNALALQPGETKSITWTFTDHGKVLYGCHVPGHYAAGMVGSIAVGWQGS